MRLQKAIREFLGNELQLDPQSLTPDTLFSDLGLNESQISDLMRRLQDALGLVLPEEPSTPIVSIGDIFSLFEDEPEPDA